MKRNLLAYRIAVAMTILIILILGGWVVSLHQKTKKPANVICTDGLCVSKTDFPFTVHYERREDLPPSLKKCPSNTILVESGGKVLCPAWSAP